jgi:glycerol-3-phosphate dehydrogenase (NAD(P)+)
MLGKRYSVKNAQLEMNMVAEGYYAARGMETISKTLDIEHPIASSIYQVLWEGQSPREMFEQLEKTLS